DCWRGGRATARRVRGRRRACFGVAVGGAVGLAWSVGAGGATRTGAAATVVTVMAEGPWTFSLVAVIVAEPAPTPVTRPLASTVAADGVELVHVTVRPVSV